MFCSIDPEGAAGATGGYPPPLTGLWQVSDEKGLAEGLFRTVANL
jgi:hypothetical protein